MDSIYYVMYSMCW